MSYHRRCCCHARHGRLIHRRVAVVYAAAAVFLMIALAVVNLYLVIT